MGRRPGITSTMVQRKAKRGGRRIRVQNTRETRYRLHSPRRDSLLLTRACNGTPDKDERRRLAQAKPHHASAIHYIGTRRHDTLNDGNHTPWIPRHTVFICTTDPIVASLHPRRSRIGIQAGARSDRRARSAVLQLLRRLNLEPSVEKPLQESLFRLWPTIHHHINAHSCKRWKTTGHP